MRMDQGLRVLLAVAHQEDLHQMGKTGNPQEGS